MSAACKPTAKVEAAKMNESFVNHTRMDGWTDGEIGIENNERDLE